jgi:DNA-nicking Smr family endonuclease
MLWLQGEANAGRKVGRVEDEATRRRQRAERCFAKETTVEHVGQDVAARLSQGQAPQIAHDLELHRAIADLADQRVDDQLVDRSRRKARPLELVEGSGEETVCDRAAGDRRDVADPIENAGVCREA